MVASGFHARTGQPHRHAGQAQASEWHTGRVADIDRRALAVLDQLLGAELVRALRYRGYAVVARGWASVAVAAEFRRLADEKTAYAERIAERIVRLGSTPDFSPVGLLVHGQADEPVPTTLDDMLRAGLVAERAAADTCRRLARLVEGRERDTWRLLQDILAAQEEHAEALSDWLAQRT
ncbi:ferritin-like domain-containing protein [Chitiniphilus purpureus]|uniref:Ferritin-like domain-containing protein n=1 Tax=Chitiniphilus purpureus TaxID=2981137 RepID=A0ABY6DLZ7_9NEIS|nr:ferritin-like domain-containing protein [Chitiniphilus sp. CD1]UXY15395.1 ferritin-like domain-containing protein [Chitiniphilus sp. CD1]